MASIIKVDNVQNTPGTNVVSKCGTDITLGASGDTIALACGASQTGFGRTGTVDWQTGSIKTATFTAATGEGYFCNTTAGAFELDLPAGAAGSIVSIQDYNNTFDTYALTVDPNGSEKINGGDAGDPVILDTEGQGVTFVYIDSTVGWRSVQDNLYATTGASWPLATVSGACNAIITSGDYKTAIFKGPGTFCVSQVSSCAAVNKIDYFVVAGGGGGGHASGGGGGFRLFSTAPGSNSPLNNSGASPNTEVTITATAYPITVGGGGAGTGGGSPGYTSPVATPGVASSFSTVTSAGGGYGANARCAGTSPNPVASGGPGGSGGGGAYYSTGPNPGSGGTGNTPPTSPSQGQNGGPGCHTPGAWGATGTGGGAGAAGTTGVPGGTYNAAFGSYIADPFIGPTAPSYGTPGPTSNTRYFAGGGSGSPGSTTNGGGGAQNTPPGLSPLTGGTVNTGGGSGGGFDCATPASGGAGGSGIVMIRYKFQ